MLDRVLVAPSSFQVIFLFPLWFKWELYNSVSYKIRPSVDDVVLQVSKVERKNHDRVFCGRTWNNCGMWGKTLSSGSNGSKILTLEIAL